MGRTRGKIKRETIILTAMCFAICGCAVPITKGKYAESVQSKKFYDEIFKSSPELFYCFNEKEEKLRLDFRETWTTCLNECLEKMPAMIDSYTLNAYIAETASCSLPKYIERNNKTYSIDGLPVAKRDKCIALISEAESYSKKERE